MAGTIERNNERNPIVRRQVVAALREIFSDPDAGLALTPAFARRLRKTAVSVKSGAVTDLRIFLKK